MLAKSELIGRARRIYDARGRYIHFSKSTFPEHLRLDGLKVVIDCANGAAYHVAPEALWELDAEVVPIGVTPNGLNINEDCGSTKPQLLQETVVASGADIGIALDGDADRLIVVDEAGQIIDGDQLMALIALGLKTRGELKGDGVVATVMSNLGLERKLGEAGLKLHRTKVGDRYVLEQMRKSSCNVGGEQSGHIILSDYATTGDGLVAGLQVLAALVEADKPASELLRQFEPPPQLLKNVRFSGGKPLETDKVRERIAAAEAELEGRAARHPQMGTEPLIRVMAEGDDMAMVERVVDDICGRCSRRRRLCSHLSAKWFHRAHGKFRPGGVEGGLGDEARPDPDYRRLRFGGGAGIQADIKTITMLGGHAMTAVTAITAQNTLGVSSVHPVPTEMILEQMDAIISDLGVDAVKIGMIGSAFSAGRSRCAFRSSTQQPDLPIVFDPGNGNHEWFLPR